MAKDLEYDEDGYVDHYSSYSKEDYEKNPYLYKDCIIEDDSIKYALWTKDESYGLGMINMLFDKKIIELDKIYDLNQKSFINKINKLKFNIHVENFNEAKQFYNNFSNN